MEQKSTFNFVEISKYGDNLEQQSLILAPLNFTTLSFILWFFCLNAK